MSQQTAPTFPAGRVNTVVSVTAGFAQRQEWTSVLLQMLIDLYNLRNAFDAFASNHTHTTPTSSGGTFTSVPVTNAASSGATGGTAYNAGATITPSIVTTA